jgi:[protein-PII] uridylyltransferase
MAFWRDELKRGRDSLRSAFFAHPDTPRLLREHSHLVDRVVRGVWREAEMPPALALLAVGGYGRGQLFPHSDVDVLILLPAEGTAPAAIIERFFATLWDVGIELGHAVRTVAQCESEMNSDVTIRTSLLENRFLDGSRPLTGQCRTMFAENLDVHAFYAAKTLEQQSATASEGQRRDPP